MELQRLHMRCTPDSTVVSGCRAHTPHILGGINIIMLSSYSDRQALFEIVTRRWWI